jgi:hypothetical protein
MGIVQKYVKKLRNTFHVPGEDVTILGFDDRNKSLRLYDLYVKTGPKFESKLESKSMEQNVSQVFMWYKRLSLKTHEFLGYYDKDNSNLLHVEFTIDKTEGDIFKTDDKPEGLVYLFDMQTGQGGMLIRKEKKESLFEDTEPKEITKTEVASSEFATVTIPQQIRIKRDPVIDMLFTINPFMIGSMIDSFIATDLLRGKVEMWKMLVVAGMTLVFGLVIGMGIK